MTSRRLRLGASAAAICAAGALLLTPLPASADHCPGPWPTAMALRSARTIVLARVVGAHGTDSGTFPFGTYDFATIRSYRGPLGSRFSMTGAALSCIWPAHDAVLVGDRFVLSVGEPNENSERLRAYWRIGPGDRIDEAGHQPSDHVATLHDLERLIVRYALPDTALASAATTTRRPPETRLLLVGIPACGSIWLFWRRRRSATGGAWTEDAGHARLCGQS